MKPKVCIDGEVGTTGLRIRAWLAGRDDLDLLSIDEAVRKDPRARRERVLASDVAILCLPDEAAREVTSWVAGTPTRLIDASTAHRVAGGWVYGLPELTAAQRRLIAGAQLVSNPGCYAAAFLLLVRPLIDDGLLARETALAVHALSGYSGGGRSLIQRWEDPALGLASLPYEAPYAFGRQHKHIPEMMKFSGLSVEPQFLPAVGPFACGMRVQVAVHATTLPRGSNGRRMWESWRDRYEGEPFVRVAPLESPAEPDERVFDPRACNDTNRVELRMLPHPSGHIVLMAVLDNLGKGAAGTAIQSLNLMLGVAETTGLAC